jgi:hypothetical protein
MYLWQLHSTTSSNLPSFTCSSMSAVPRHCRHHYCCPDGRHEFPHKDEAMGLGSSNCSPTMPRSTKARKLKQPHAQVVRERGRTGTFI